MINKYNRLNIFNRMISKANIKLNSMIPQKAFRDYRDQVPFYFPDNRERIGYHGSPYKAQFTLSEEERIENDKLPVEERVLDWNKYMKHKGKLKYTTGVYLIDVEPFPRLKIMMLCDLALSYLRKIPDSHAYKHMSFQHIKYIMNVVDENESIVDIESKISNANKAEDIILMLHNEVLLLRIIVRDKLWDVIEQQKKKGNTKEFFFASAAFRDTSYPFAGPVDSTKHKKNERPERSATAGFSEWQSQKH